MDLYRFTPLRLAMPRFPARNRGPSFTQRLFANLFLHRVFYKMACAVVLPLCALASIATTLAAPDAQTSTRASVEWPREWNGAALRPLAMTDVELRFASRFPGAMARMTDGQQVLVLRRVDEPTRMLHPAADCYQGLGWHIAQQALQQDADHKIWRCFDATKASQTLRVCERIEDTKGQSWTDTSAWYWAATLGQSTGPWQAVTTAHAI